MLRVWVDLTAPAHPVVLGPIVRLLRERGHDVEVTARDYAQTLELSRTHGLGDAVAFGAHGGARRLDKLTSLVGRTAALTRWARSRRFDLAVGHGSNDLALAAAALRIPAVNMFDYEWATVQHSVGCRPARRVLVPEAIPPERLARYGAGPEKLVQFPGLKEEYYLHGFAPDEAVLDALGVERGRVVVVVRPPPDVSLYHRRSNPLFGEVLARVGHDPDVHAVVVPRTAEQRAHVEALALPSVIVPRGAVDAQSLIALADLVVSAGGTMNREAVALGTPVYTTYGGRLGGVDEWLIRENRLRPATDARAIVIEKRPRQPPTERRDPALLCDLILGALL